MGSHSLAKTACLRWFAAAGVAAGLAAATGAQAQTRMQGFRLGLTLPAGQFGATMQKTVDNTAPGTLVPEPRRGRVFRDEASGSGFAYGAGVAAGYRMTLAGGSWFLDGEADFEWHGGETEAQFAGVGVSDERKQLGESWPDRWTLGRKTSRGATLRFGGSPGGLGSSGLAAYVLAGVRFADAQFANRYVGCFSPEPCEPSEFGSGEERLDFDFTAWKAGIGLEKSLGARFAMRVEASYSIHAAEEWTTPFDDVGVTVYSSMDASDLGFSLGLVRFF